MLATTTTTTTTTARLDRWISTDEPTLREKVHELREAIDNGEIDFAGLEMS